MNSIKNQLNQEDMTGNGIFFGHGWRVTTPTICEWLMQIFESAKNPTRELFARVSQVSLLPISNFHQESLVFF
jgi:hypothetical protein